MRPLTVLIGILLGTSVSATFSLSALSLISALLSGAHPELSEQVSQLRGLLIGCWILTAAAAASFVGQLKMRTWRRHAHLLTLTVLAALVLWCAR
ncbi:MAG TPA: hypothetical protein VND80_00230 [Steroidobacteraceae bacterium]|nr:hypothetical protein [Steroidobacteraceae bacterium]